MSIKIRIIATLLTLLSLIMIMAFLTHIIIGRQKSEILFLETSILPASVDSLALEDKLDEMNANILEFLTGETEELVEFENNYQNFITLFKRIAEMDAIDKKDEDEIRLLTEVYYRTVQDQVLKDFSPEKKEVALKNLDRLEHDVFNRLKTMLDTISATKRVQAENALKTLTVVTRNNQILLWIVTLMIICLGIIVIWLVYKNIFNPLSRINTAMVRIAGGDHDIELSEEIQPDEIGHLNLALKTFMTLQKERDIMEKQLVVEKDRAIKAKNAKSLFLANMSHEIRTPMNAIIGMAYLALDTDLSPAQKDYIEKIKTTADNLHRILNDILDFSKIEAGRLELEKAPFSLKKLFSRIETHITVLNQKKKLVTKIETGPGVPDVLIGDQLRLEQVIVNLVNNAFKFTETGFVKIYTEPAEKKENQIFIRFKIRDSGTGINKRKRDTIFAAFSQEDASTTRKHGGTGLGLSISKNIVSLMDGTMKVESRPGKGSTFSFTAGFGLPVESEIDKRSSESALSERFDFSGKRVLLVEDNALNRQVIGELLEKKGLSVFYADSCNAAIDFASSHTCDLVLMDIQMPGEDGFETTRRLRTIEAYKSIPVLAMTARAMKGDRTISLESGMDDHITKPIDPDRLLAMVARYLA